ncbi:MAG: cation:proton antiporter [Acidobacteriota bacterium]|nr:cation:proton antiporter [Acidobacteriota bacterium]MDH3522112.1 cation:proton antiporter [Acidobacteriota bacterium]
MTAAQLSVAFFLQMFFILAVCRLVGMAARKIGQPQVVGEMIAGVLMGPSLFGLVWPRAQQFLFPPDSLEVLYVGAQLGVGLYMFIVGIEFKTDLFRSRARSAAAVSLAGILVPFLLGAALALWLIRVPGLIAESVDLHEAMLFMGASMAITAFPMLARIIYERGLTGTALGTLALAAGAIDDAVAWCVLAVVLASFGGGWGGAALAIGGGAAYAVIITLLGRRALAPLGTAAERHGDITPSVLAIVLMLFMFAAWGMDAIGIHAVFGGFLLGTAMPRGQFAAQLRRQLEPFAVVFLLPMFFTYSGLNTRLDMVNTWELLLIALVALAAAIGGKGVACWAAARLTGEDNRTALAVGTLMNARGLMELIILNIGLSKGVIGLPLFSIMVLMAIVTTLMASPLFELVYGRHARAAGTLHKIE